LAHSEKKETGKNAPARHRKEKGRGKGTQRRKNASTKEPNERSQKTPQQIKKNQKLAYWDHTGKEGPGGALKRGEALALKDPRKRGLGVQTGQNNQSGGELKRPW